jgi:hypothetical protein
LSDAGTDRKEYKRVKKAGDILRDYDSIFPFDAAGNAVVVAGH